MRATLIGWAANTGLGSMNRDIAAADWVTKWLVPKHPILGYSKEIRGNKKVKASRRPVPPLDFRWATTDTDALIFVETPYLNQAQLADARRRGVKIICIPMMDQLNVAAPWISEVDLMWAPTITASRLLHDVRKQRYAAGLPVRYAIAGDRWGIDITRFKFRQRTVCERFLFINGWGGVSGRKGLDVVMQAVRALTKIPITILSQRKIREPFADNVQLINGDQPTNHNLYEYGDVLLLPSKFEGLGLQIFEAKACGVPYIATDAGPMSEQAPIRRIACERSGVSNGCSPVWDVSVESLMEAMQDVYQTDISLCSDAGRDWIVKAHNIKVVLDQLKEAIAKLSIGLPITA